MNCFKYNDNEIIYLIRSGNEYAYDFINAKYKKYIYSKIKKFGLNDIDDSFQEGLIALYHAVISYDESYDKTFNRYFDFVLTNRFVDIKRKVDTNYEVFMVDRIDNTKFILKEGSSYDIRMEDIYKATSFLSEKESMVFKMLYIEKHSVLEISNITNINPQYLYKLIYQIKKKIKKNVIK